MWLDNPFTDASVQLRIVKLRRLVTQTLSELDQVAQKLRELPAGAK